MKFKYKVEYFMKNNETFSSIRNSILFQRKGVDSSEPLFEKNVFDRITAAHIQYRSMLIIQVKRRINQCKRQKKTKNKFKMYFLKKKKIIEIFSRVVQFDNHVLVAAMTLLAA